MGFSKQEFGSGFSFPPPGESSGPRDRTHVSYVSCAGGRIFTTSAAWEACKPGRQFSRSVMSNSLRPHGKPERNQIVSSKEKVNFMVCNLYLYSAVFKIIMEVGFFTSLLVCNTGDLGSISGWGRFPWRRAWQPSPGFLPRESHGKRRLVGYSPWGCKELNMTEQLMLVYFAIFRAKSFSSVVIHQYPCCGDLSNGVSLLLFSR